MNWAEKNLEWLKSIISDTYVNGVAGKPSSRKIMEFMVIWAFVVSYFKIAIASATVIDMPVTWGMVIIGILGLKVYGTIKSNTANKEGVSETQSAPHANQTNQE